MLAPANGRTAQDIGSASLQRTHAARESTFSNCVDDDIVSVATIREILFRIVNHRSLLSSVLIILILTGLKSPASY
jgi:hypothetical protein